MMMIGLAGFAGSGKSTLAGMLADEGWQEFAFAAPLKRLVHETNPLIRLAVNVLGAERAKRWLPFVRRGYQRFGQSVREVLGEDVWVNATLRDANRVTFGEGGLVVISDVRHPNEAQAIRYMGGVIIRVKRDGVGPVNDHVSEVPVSADVTIKPNDLDEMREYARMIDLTARSSRNALDEMRMLQAVES